MSPRVLQVLQIVAACLGCLFVGVALGTWLADCAANDAGPRRIESFTAPPGPDVESESTEKFYLRLGDGAECHRWREPDGQRRVICVPAE